MKIINFEDFLKLPPGVVCMKYKPCHFGSIFIKGESLARDFYLTYLTDEIDARSSDEMVDKLDQAEKSGGSVDMSFDTDMRDGLFEGEQLYAVYGKADVVGLISRLTGCLTAYDEGGK